MKNIVKAIGEIFSKRNDADEFNGELDVREDGPYYPFCFHSDKEDEHSVTLYHEDEFMAALFNRHNRKGNGTDWQLVAEYFIDSEMPEARELVWFGSDERLFKAFSEDSDTLHDFVRRFREFCDDEELMERALASVG